MTTSPGPQPRLSFGARLGGSVDLRDLGALLGIASAVAWLYWRAIFESGVWFPAGGGDLASLIYPNYRFAAESLLAGDLPLWNPYIQSGAPFAADIQSGLLYPVNLIVFALAPRVTYRLVEGLALFHVWLAGALAYLAARGFGLPRPAAAVAGVAYALSDYFIVHIGNLNLIAVAAWLPLILLCAHRAAETVNRKWIGVGAAAVGLAALAGHAQPLLYALLIVGLIGVLHAWTRLGAGQAAAAARVVVALSAMVGLGLCAAAIQLVPAAELTRLSLRAAIPFEKSTEYSLAPEQLVSLIVPGFFGRGPDNYWGQWLRTEAGYVGILTLVLAGLAFRLRTPVRPDPRPMLTVVAGGGLLVALGGYTGLYGLIYRFVPLFGSLRGPARAVVVFDLALAFLAAVGLAATFAAIDRSEAVQLRRALRGYQRLLWGVLAFAPGGLVLLMLLREHQSLPRATGIVEGWLLLALWLAGSLALLNGWRLGWISAATCAALAAGWLTLDLVTNAQGLELTRQDPVSSFERPQIVEFLRRDGEPFRIDSDTGVWDIWQPNTAMVQRLPDVVGGIHPLELSDFRRYWSGLGSRSSPLYDLLNARYLIGRKGVPLDPSKFELVFDSDAELSVFRNVRALPRAFLVAGAIPAADHEQAYALIHQPGFDPRVGAVLEAADEALARGSAGDARIAFYGNTRVSIDVVPTGPGWLVLSETWYPGWSATIDGRPTPVLRANYLFRAVSVAPGDRRIELRFEPTGWRIAATVTGSAWLAIALLTFARRRGR